MANVAFQEVEAPSLDEAASRSAEAADVRPVPRISIQAFCESPDLAATIEAASTDRRMMRAHVKAHMGGITAAAEFYAGASTPNLVIVESHHAGERLVSELARLAEV